MNGFLTKLAMLILFLLAITCGWAALVMQLPSTLFNVLLGVLAFFFFFRALELADKVNKLGPYSSEDKDKSPHKEQ